MPLDPTVEAMLKQMADAGGPSMTEMEPAAAREMYRAMGAAKTRADVHEVSDREIADVPVRIYRPAATTGLPALVFFHGGGWVIGDLETHDGDCRTLANAAGCVVIAIDYRLAPEHRYPAALDDCYAVATAVAEMSEELGIDPERIAVGGDSAGGNLAASVALKARDGSGPSFVHQLLIYPVTDAHFETDSYRDNAEGYMLTRQGMEWFFDHYVPDASARQDPLVAPLRASHHGGLPPATIITAEYDPLRDEGEALGARLEAAGVPVVTRRYDGMIHGFFGMTDLLEGARAANQFAAGRLRTAFGLEAS